MAGESGNTMQYELSALPAREFLNGLHAKRRQHGTQVVELDGAVSERGGFLPLAWAEELLKPHIVRCLKTAADLGAAAFKEALQQPGVGVHHPKHGRGHVVSSAVGASSADAGGHVQLIFDDMPQELISYSTDSDVLQVEHVVITSLPNWQASAPPHVGGAMQSLPPSHATWDSAAAGMPAAWRQGRFAALVDGMDPGAAPGADASELPAEYLPRAAMIFALMSHGYHYFGGNSALPPDHLFGPWRAVARRLHRPQPCMDINDLVLCNWCCIDPATSVQLALAAASSDPRTGGHGSLVRHSAAVSADAATVAASLLVPTVWSVGGLTAPDGMSKLAVLVPVFGGRAGHVATEDNFLCTIVHMHMLTAPLIELCVACQEAAMSNMQSRLEELLTEVKRCIDAATASFLNICPDPGSATYCDPIEWARTVGTIPVPISPETEAASGLQMPMFHLIDTFLDRPTYSTTYGQQMLYERERNLPVNVRGYLDAVQKVSVRRFIIASGSARLAAVWNSVVGAYIGDRGLLGVHAFKASGYLEVAVKVGRVQMNATRCDVTDWRERQWVAPVEHLQESRAERSACCIAPTGSKQAASLFSFAKITGRSDASKPTSLLAEEDGVGSGACCPFSGRRSQGGSGVGCPFGASKRKAAVGKSSTSPVIETSAHLTLDIAGTQQYQPGDIVSLCAENAADTIIKTFRAITQQRQATNVRQPSDSDLIEAAQRKLVLPNQKWLTFCCSSSIGLANGVMLSVYDVLLYGQISSLSSKTVEKILVACPHVEARSVFGQRMVFTATENAFCLEDLLTLVYSGQRALLWDKCEWLLSGTTLCDMIEPLAPRSYSVASAADGVWPRKLELCVGRQQWTQQHLAPRPRDLAKVARAVDDKPRRRSIIGGTTTNGALLGEGNTLGAGARRFKLAAAAAKSDGQFQFLTETRVGVMSNRLLDVDWSDGKPLKLRVEPSPRFHLPSDVRTPLLLFAAGTGIAPFRGFLQARLADPGSGPIALFYGVRDAATAPFVDELEAFADASGSKFKLYICISRAAARDVPRAHRYEHGHTRVPSMIKAQADWVWTMVSADWHSSKAASRRRSEGGTGSAAFYLCGFSSFVRDVESALFNLLMQRSAPAPEPPLHRATFASIVREHLSGLYAAHVFGGSVLTGSTDDPIFTLAEVARRRGGVDGLDEAWWIYQGHVYDVTRYAHLHPGGDKIILDKAGRDATVEFQRAHSANLPEYEAIMQVYRLGKLRLPFFSSKVDTQAWEHLVQTLHYATEVCNVVRTESQATNIAVVAGPVSYCQPRNEPLLCFQKVVHRGGYHDRLAAELAIVSAKIGAVLPALSDEADALAQSARLWAEGDEQEMRSASRVDLLLSKATDARARVLEHSSTSGRCNFEENAAEMGHRLLATARAVLDEVQLALVESVELVERKGAETFTDDTAGRQLLVAVSAAIARCFQMYVQLDATIAVTDHLSKSHKHLSPPTDDGSSHLEDALASFRFAVRDMGIKEVPKPEIATTKSALGVMIGHSCVKVAKEADRRSEGKAAPSDLVSVVARALSKAKDDARRKMDELAAEMGAQDPDAVPKGPVRVPHKSSDSPNDKAEDKPRRRVSVAVALNVPVGAAEASKPATIAQKIAERMSRRSKPFSSARQSRRTGAGRKSLIASQNPNAAALEMASAFLLENPLAGAIDRAELKETFPLYAMRLCDFLALPTMLTHEEALEKGLLVEWQPSMGPLNFISHQWVGGSIPDPENEQLGVIQEFFNLVLQATQDAEVAALFPSDKEWEKYKRGDTAWYNDSGEYHNEWTVQTFQRSLSKGFIWLDYHSVPQGAHRKKEQRDAIDSIFAYVSCATNFFVLAPPSLHSITGKDVGFGSWRERGWCRLEDWCSEMRANSSRRPLILTSGRSVQVVDILDKLTFNARREESPYLGDFAVDSDRDLIHPVFAGSLLSKLHSLLEVQDVFHYRWFMFAAPHLLAKTDKHDGLGHGDAELWQFLRRYGFSWIDECPARMPFMPLFCACAEGNAAMVTALLDAKADPNQWDDNGIVNPMHGAATYGSPICCALLLKAGAVAHAPSRKMRLTPLHRASAGGHVEQVRMLLDARADVDPVRLDSGRTPAHMAALNGHRQVLQMLADAGANLDLRDTDGDDTPNEILRKHRALNWGAKTPKIAGAGERLTIMPMSVQTL